MTFDADFAADALPDLLDEHGEDVIYRPNGGTPRTISAMVNRNPPQPIPGLDSAVTVSMTITVENHGTRGIEAGTELDTGGDLVDVAERVGGAAESRPIVKLLNDNGGALVLAIR